MSSCSFHELAKTPIEFVMSRIDHRTRNSRMYTIVAGLLPIRMAFILLELLYMLLIGPEVATSWTN